MMKKTPLPLRFAALLTHQSRSGYGEGRVAVGSSVVLGEATQPAVVGGGIVSGNVRGIGLRQYVIAGIPSCL